MEGRGVHGRLVVISGPSGAGKTSMHSVIFANFPAKNTEKIGYTVEKQ